MSAIRVMNVASIARPIRWFRRAQVGIAILALGCLLFSLMFLLQSLERREVRVEGSLPVVTLRDGEYVPVTQAMREHEANLGLAASISCALLVILCGYLWKAIPRGSYVACGTGILLSLSVWSFVAWMVASTWSVDNLNSRDSDLTIALILGFYLSLGALALGITAVSLIPSRRLLRELGIVGYQDCYKLARPRLPKHWRSAVRGTASDRVLLASVAILRALSVLLLALFTIGILAFQGLVAQLFVLTLAGAAWRLSMRLTRIRERRRVMSAAELRSRDNRPPILLLRSFRDDAQRVGTDRFRTLFIGKAVFEEEITRTLAQYGPVVAIGQPGESLPSLGAAREYLTHDDWQSRVSSLVSASSLVVLIAAETPGVAWELEHILERSAHGKLVLLMPALKPAELRRRWKAVREPVSALFGEEVAQFKFPGKILLVVKSETSTFLMRSARRDRISYNVALLLASRLLLKSQFEAQSDTAVA